MNTFRIRNTAGIMLLLAGSFLMSCQQRSAPEPDRPNIIFIMADDLGYGDLGCYGQEEIRTPFLDKMASEGMRFTQAYAGHTVCAPSRSALMTGQHTGHTPVRGNTSREGERVPLPDAAVTVAEVLKTRGYVNGLFGKWGLGEPETEGIPGRQGFDEFYGYLNQARAHNYYVDYLWHNEEKVIFPENEGGKEVVHSAEWCFEQLKGFVRDNQDQSFFVYYAATLPHAELRSAGQDLESYLNEQGESRFSEKPFPEGAHGHYGATDRPYATYAAMVSQLDRHVGELDALLDSLGIAENTLVFFTSDNGPHQEGGYDPEYFGSNGPFRGIKRDLYEGGIRVPLVVKWPEKIKPGGVSTYPWASWDLLPTLAEITGAEQPGNLDGVSALPVLLGEQRERPGVLYWETTEGMQGDLKAAVREGKWKLVWNGLLNPPELYDLDADPSETRDLATEHPRVVQRLRELVRESRTPSQHWPVDDDALRRLAVGDGQ